MPRSNRKSKGTQRKLNFQVQKNDEINDDDYEVIVDEEQTRRSAEQRRTTRSSTRKRGVTSQQQQQQSSVGSPTKKKKEQRSTTTTTASIDDFLSPIKKTSERAAAIVTPPKDEGKIDSSKRDEDDKEPYVPTYIHKNLDYHSKYNNNNNNNNDLSTLNNNVSEITMKIFHWIKVHYNIPNNIEQCRIYGPLSGSNYYEHVIRAYQLNKLTKINDNDTTKICIECAETDHIVEECPKLV